MKTILTVLSLFLFTTNGNSLDFSSTKPSVNIEVAQVQTRPIQSLIDFVTSSNGSLEKVNKNAVTKLCSRINKEQEREQKGLQLCDSVYFASFPDDSYILVQVDKDNNVIMSSMVQLNKSSLERAKVILPEVFQNLEVVPTGKDV